MRYAVYVRTTLRIDDGLLREAKLRAASTGRTLGEVVEDALRVALAPPGAERGAPAPLPAFGGSGVLPGVDLGDSSALRDLMEAGEPLDARR